MQTHFLRYACLPLALLIAALAVACGDDDDSPPAGSETPDASEDASPDGTPVPNPLTPPLEGPGRSSVSNPNTDFRADPAWRAPSPDTLDPSEDTDDPVVNPPVEPVCPPDWTVIQRPNEGFEICHPSDWTIAGHGYVNSPNEAQWYSVGIVDFADATQARQRAHVSVYVIPAFAQPFRYTLDCPEAFSVTLSGEPAVVCPDFPATSPEARIISYHVFREERDYFVQAVSYFEYDEDEGEYSGDVSADAESLAIQIAQTFKLTPVQ